MRRAWWVWVFLSALVYAPLFIIAFLHVAAQPETGWPLPFQNGMNTRETLDQGPPGRGSVAVFLNLPDDEVIDQWLAKDGVVYVAHRQEDFLGWQRRSCVGAYRLADGSAINSCFITRLDQNGAFRYDFRVLGDVIAVKDDYYHFTLINVTNFQTLWGDGLPSAGSWQMVFRNDDSVYYVDENRRLRRVRLHEGPSLPVWEQYASNEFYSVLALGDGKLFARRKVGAGPEGHYLTAYDLDDGAVVGNREVDSDTFFLAYHNGVLYDINGQRDYQIIGYDAASPTLPTVFFKSVGNDNIFSYAFKDGFLYLGLDTWNTNFNHVKKLNLATGNYEWDYFNPVGSLNIDVKTAANGLYTTWTRNNYYTLIKHDISTGLPEWERESLIGGIMVDKRIVGRTFGDADDDLSVYPYIACGNGMVEPGEECDDPDWGRVTACTDFDEFTGGILTCNPPGEYEGCFFNTSRCVKDNTPETLCGNGIIEANETCDGDNWGPITGCWDFDSFTGGNLSCIPPGMPGECHFNTGACVIGANPTPMICGDVYWADALGRHPAILNTTACNDTLYGRVPVRNPPSDCPTPYDCVYMDEMNATDPVPACYYPGQNRTNYPNETIICIGQAAGGTALHVWCPLFFVWDDDRNLCVFPGLTADAGRMYNRSRPDQLYDANCSLPRGGWAKNITLRFQCTDYDYPEGMGPPPYSAEVWPKSYSACLNFTVADYNDTQQQFRRFGFYNNMSIKVY